MKIGKAILVLFALAFAIGQAYAFDGITFYGAKITEKDRFNSYGERLISVREVLRQDRANYHKFYRRDREDQHDDYFMRSSNRAMFNNATIVVSPRLKRRILGRGKVYVTVFVYPGKIVVKHGLPDPNVN